MSTFTSMPILSKISIPVFAVAAVLHIVGFSCPNWVSFSFLFRGVPVQGTGGIWKGCSAGICTTYPTNVVGTLKAVQAFECLGIVAIAASIGLFVMFILKPSQQLDRLCGIFKIVAGVCILIGVIIFGVDTRNIVIGNVIVQSLMYHLEWAFGLCATAGILAMAAGVLGLVGASQRTPSF